ncbi:hypothetical protein PoB_004296200 [Plakobranchus ocellatus]|uniref:Uncharacterized protein n=1 Tax=Plakobranchus ocellatus TaxID=259542 RepID=A0AAV4BBF6_9GAST|nr:hypothetical protein PoB_004296200 [Plakobranchus ocellatus]
MMVFRGSAEILGFGSEEEFPLFPRFRWLPRLQLNKRAMIRETPLFPLFKPLKKLSDSNNPACSSSLQTTSTSSASSPSDDQLRLIPLSDRTANLEAMILSMMAENNISFSVAPKLVELIRECCNDPKALAGVALDRCVAEERKKDLDQQVHVLTTIAKAKSIKQHAIKKAFKRHQSTLGGPSKRRKY